MSIFGNLPKTGKFGAPHEIRYSPGAAPALRRRGFTLVELLVVIVIIGILSSLLLAAVNKTMRVARKGECLTRFRQWGSAFIEYSHDHDGWIPRECARPIGYMRSESWADISGRPIPGMVPPRSSTSDVWYNALPGPYLRGIQPASHYSLKNIKADFYEKDSFFQCPAARFPRNVHKSLLVYFSMAMNSQLITPYSAPTIRITQLSDPSRTVIFLDSLQIGEKKVHPKQYDWDLGQPAAWATRFAGNRHGQVGNLAFADGHVASEQGTKVVTMEGEYEGKAPPHGPIIWQSGVSEPPGLKTIKGYPIYE